MTSFDKPYSYFCFKFYIMAQMILKGKELIRINPSNKHKIEYSSNDGRSWTSRYSGSGCGDFNDLTDNGQEILAVIPYIQSI